MSRVRHNNEAPSVEVLSRRYRVTIALVDFHDGSLGPGPEGRTDLGRNAVLARLDEAESARLTGSLIAPGDRPYARVAHRLEILDVPTGHIHDEARLLLQQFMLVVRAPLPVIRAVVDYKIGPTFYRGGYISLDTNSRNRHGFRTERLATLRSLREGMGPTPVKEVTRALDHYEQSVRSLWRGDIDNALVLAALAFECLLGDNVTSEISYRLCLRATLLVGQDNQHLFQVLRKLYDLRSRIVHGGAKATRQDVTYFQQVLMRLIPSVEALAHECGGYKMAIKALDSMAVGAQTQPLNTTASDGWWSYVPLGECLARPVAEAGVSDAWGADVRLYDYWTSLTGA